MIVRFLIWLSRRNSVSRETRIQILNELIHHGGGIPLHAIITADEGKTLIRGVPLDVPTALAFQESAQRALDNSALKTVREQIRYEAVKHGIHNALTLDQVYFAKAALWVLDQEDEMLTNLAGTGNQTP